jgi:dTDP-glucose 4,6-dehydratase
VDNLITGTQDNIKHNMDNDNFIFIWHDICKPLMVEEKIDSILHFASPASPFDYLNFPIQTLKVGSIGTHNCLGLAKAKGAKFLFASTSEIYGDPLVHPQKEEYWGNVNPVGPRSVYDEAKRFSEAMTMAYFRAHDLDTKIVRIFNTFGPRMRLEDGRVIPNFLCQALRGEDINIYGDGSQTRSFCFVKDLVEGISRLLSSDIHEPVNIGNPVEMTVKQLSESIVRITKSKSKTVFVSLPEDDPKQRKPDITRAESILKWRPKVDFQEGISLTIDWFRKNIS